MKNLDFLKKLVFLSLIAFAISSSFQIKAQNGLWEGDVDNKWETVSNWFNNQIPDNNIDVVIKSGCTYYPLVDNAGQSCKSLTIEDGGTLSMCTGSTLTINGNLTVGTGASGVFIGQCGTINITGELILNSGSQATITDCIINCPSANLNNSSTVFYDGTNTELYNWTYGNLILNGTGTMTVSGDYLSPTYCENLTINNTGNTLKIPVGKALTVYGTMTNNVGDSGILLESDLSGDGSLIINTSNVNATVERYLTGDRWHYVSGPVNQSSTSIFNTNNLLWWDASMEWAGSGDFDPWKSVSSPNLENAVGYAYYTGESTLNYTGEINTNNYSLTLYKSLTGSADDQGWNLVGNPYTSILDWDALVADGSVPSGAENAIYFFDDDGSGSQSNYRYYVPSTGGTYGVGTEDANGYVPMGQAFFVKTNTDNINLTLKSSYRTHFDQEFYKDNKDELIKIRISNQDYSDQLILRNVNNSTLDFDSDFDARKLFASNENIPQIYCFSDLSLQKTAINSVPSFSESTEIKLGFKANIGSYKIIFENILLTNSEMYLFDRYENKLINTKGLDSYSFYHTGGEINDRFVLKFKQYITSLNQIENVDIDVFPNPATDYLRIKTTNGTHLTKVQIMSLLGKEIFSKEVYSDNFSTDISSVQAGVYILILHTSNNQKTNIKIVIKD